MDSFGWFYILAPGQWVASMVRIADCTINVQREFSMGIDKLDSKERHYATNSTRPDFELFSKGVVVNKFYRSGFFLLAVFATQIFGQQPLGEYWDFANGIQGWNTRNDSTCQPNFGCLVSKVGWNSGVLWVSDSVTHHYGSPTGQCRYFLAVSRDLALDRNILVKTIDSIGITFRSAAPDTVRVIVKGTDNVEYTFGYVVTVSIGGGGEDAGELTGQVLRPSLGSPIPNDTVKAKQISVYLHHWGNEVWCGGAPFALSDSITQVNLYGAYFRLTQPPVITSTSIPGYVPNDTAYVMPSSFRIMGTRDTISSTSYGVKWRFEVPGDTRRADSGTYFFHMSQNQTSFDITFPVTIPERVGKRATFSLRAQVFDSIEASTLKSEFSEIDYLYGRSRPILDTILLVGDKFGTPESLVVRFQAPPNSKRLDGDTLPGTTIYTLNYQPYAGSSFPYKPLALAGVNPGDTVIERRVPVDLTDLPYFPTSYGEHAYITSEDSTVPISNMVSYLYRFARNVPALSFSQAPATTEERTFVGSDVKFRLKGAILRGADEQNKDPLLVGKPVTLKAVVKPADSIPPNAEYDSISAGVFGSTDVYTFGPVEYSYPMSAYLSGTPLRLYVKAFSIYGSQTDSAVIEFTHRISVPGFQAQISDTINPKYAFFPANCRIQDVFTPILVPDGMVGHVKFVSAADTSDSTKWSIVRPCTLGVNAGILTARWNADLLWNQDKQPLNGKYRLLISIFAQGDTIHSVGGDGDLFEFTWGAPTISFSAGAPAGWVFGSGAYWYRAKPDSITVSVAGNNRYGGKPVKVYLKIDATNSTTAPFDIGNWYHAATFDSSQYHQNLKLSFLPNQNITGRGYIVGVAEVVSGTLDGNSDSLRATGQKYPIGVDSLPAEIAKIVTDSIGETGNLQIIDDTLASFTVWPKIAGRAPPVSQCTTRVVGNGKDTLIQVSYYPIGGYYSKANFNLPKSPLYNWANVDTNAIADSMRASKYEFTVRPNNILNYPGDSTTIPFIIDIRKPERLKIGITYNSPLFQSESSATPLAVRQTHIYALNLRADSAFDATPTNFRFHRRVAAADSSTAWFSGSTINACTLSSADTLPNGKSVIRLEAMDALGHNEFLAESLALDFQMPELAGDTAYLNNARDSLVLSWTALEKIYTDNMTPEGNILYSFVLVNASNGNTLDSVTHPANHSLFNSHLWRFHVTGVGSPGTQGTPYFLYVYGSDSVGNRNVSPWKINTDGTVQREARPETWYFGQWAVIGKRFAVKTAKPFAMRIDLTNPRQRAALGLAMGDTAISVDSNRIVWIDSSRSLAKVAVLPESCSLNIRMNGDSSQPQLTARGFRLYSGDYRSDSANVLYVDKIRCTGTLGRTLGYNDVAFDGYARVAGIYGDTSAAHWTYRSPRWSLDRVQDKFTSAGILLNGDLNRNGAFFVDSMGSHIAASGLRLRADSLTQGGTVSPFIAKPDSTVYEVLAAALDDDSLHIRVDTCRVHFYSGVVPSATPWGNAGQYSLYLFGLAYHADTTLVPVPQNWATRIDGTTTLVPFPVSAGINSIFASDSIMLNPSANLVFHNPIYASYTKAIDTLENDSVIVTSYGARGDIKIKNPAPYEIGRWGFASIVADSAMIHNGGAVPYTTVYGPKVRFGFENMPMPAGIAGLPGMPSIDSMKYVVKLGIDSIPIMTKRDLFGANKFMNRLLDSAEHVRDSLVAISGNLAGIDSYRDSLNRRIDAIEATSADQVKSRFGLYNSKLKEYQAALPESLKGLARTGLDSLLPFQLPSWFKDGLSLSNFSLLDTGLVFDSLQVKLPGGGSNSRIKVRNVTLGASASVVAGKPKGKLTFEGTFVLDSGSFYLDSAKIPYANIGMKWGACSLFVSTSGTRASLGAIKIKLPPSFSPKLAEEKATAFLDTTFREEAESEALLDSALQATGEAKRILDSLVNVARQKTRFVFDALDNKLNIREFKYQRPVIDTFPYFDSALVIYGKLGFRVWLDSLNPHYSVRIDSAGVVLNKCGGLPYVEGTRMLVDSLTLEQNKITSFAGTIKVAQDTAEWDTTFGVFDFKLPSIGLKYDGKTFDATLNGYALRLSSKFPIDSLRNATAKIYGAGIKFHDLYHPAFIFDTIQVPLPGGKLSWEPPPFKDPEKLQIDLTKITGFFGDNKALQIDGDIIFGSQFPFAGLRTTKTVGAIRIGYDEIAKKPRLDSILCDASHPAKQIPLASLATVSYTGLKINYSGRDTVWSFTIKNPQAKISENLNELEALRGKTLQMQELTLNTLGKILNLELSGEVGSFSFLGFQFRNQDTLPMQMGIEYDTTADKYSASITNAKITTPDSLPWLGGKTVEIDTFMLSQDGYVSKFRAGIDFDTISMPFKMKVAGLRAEIAKIDTSKDPGSFGRNYELSLLHGNLVLPKLAAIPLIQIDSGTALTLDTVTVNFAGTVLKKKFGGSLNLSASWGDSTAAFRIAVEGLTLNETKAIANKASLTLPPILKSKTIALTRFSIDGEGVSFDSINLPPFEIPLYGGSKLVFDQFSLLPNDCKIVGKRINVVLPTMINGSVSITDIEIDPRSDAPYIHAKGADSLRITLDARSLHVPIDKIGLDELVLTLSYTEAGGFGFRGAAQGKIPGIGGSMGASVSLVEEELPYLFPHLREACLRFKSSGQGLPVGATGVYLNGMEGCYWQGPWNGLLPDSTEYAEYCFRDARMDGRRLQLRLYFTVGGDAIKGEVGFWVNVESIDVVEFGKVVIVGFVEGTECVGMTQNFSSLRGQVTIEINKFTGVRIYAGAQVHIWEDKASGKGKFTAQAEMGVQVKKGAFGKVNLLLDDIPVPPSELDAKLGGRVGDFANGQRGGMVYAKFPIIGEYGAFMSSGGISLGSPGDYPLDGGGSWHLDIPTPGDLSIFMNYPGDSAKLWLYDSATGRTYREGDPDVETYRDHRVLAMAFKNLPGGDSVVVYDTLIGDTSSANFMIKAKFTPTASLVSLDTITETQRGNGYSVYRLAGTVTGNKEGRLSLAASPVHPPCCDTCDTCTGIPDSVASYTGDIITDNIGVDSITGAFSYDWNTRSFENDSYHVYAAYEEPNPSRDSVETHVRPYKEPVYSNWLQYATVDNDLHLAPPKNVTIAPVDSHNVDVAWELPDSAPAVQGFVVRYGKNSNDLPTTVYAGMVRSVRIGGLEPLTPIYLSVAPYCKIEKQVGDSTITEEVFGNGTTPVLVTPGDEGSLAVNQLYIETDTDEVDLDIGIAKEISFHVRPMVGDSFEITDDAYDRARLSVSVSRYPGVGGETDSLGLFGAITKPTLYLPTDTGEYKLTLTSLLEDVYRGNDSTGAPVCTECDSILLYKLEPRTYFVRLRAENMGNPTGTSMSYTKEIAVNAAYGKPIIGSIEPQTALSGENVVYKIHDRNLLTADQFVFIDSASGTPYTADVDTARNDWAISFGRSLNAGTYHAAIVLANGRSDTLESAIHVASADSCAHSLFIERGWADTGASLSLNLDKPLGSVDTAAWQVWYKPQGNSKISCPVTWAKSNYLTVKVPNSISKGSFMVHRLGGTCDTLVSGDFYSGPGPQTSIFPANDTTVTDSLRFAASSNADSIVVQLNNDVPFTYTDTVTLRVDSGEVATEYLVKAFSVDSIGRRGPVTAVKYTLVRKAVVVASPQGGTFDTLAACTLSIADGLPADIRFSLDGSNVTAGSILYNGPITITSSATLKFRAYRNGIAGPQDSAAFTINNALSITIVIDTPATTSSFAKTSPALVSGHITSGRPAQVLVQGKVIPVVSGLFQTDVPLNEGANTVEVSSIYRLNTVSRTVVLDSRRPFVYAAKGGRTGAFQGTTSDTLKARDSTAVTIYASFGNTGTYDTSAAPLAFQITADTIVRFFGVDQAGNVSDTITERYRIVGNITIAATPDPDSTYRDPVEVTLDVTTPGREDARLYYSLDTSTQIDSFSTYAGPVTLYRTGVLRAYAVDRFDTSAVFSFNYTIADTLQFTPLALGNAAIFSKQWHTDTLVIKGKGQAFGAMADTGMLAYQKLDGDFDVSLHLLAPDTIQPWAAAGLMIRSDTIGSGPMAWVKVNWGGAAAVSARPLTGMSAFEVNLPHAYLAGGLTKLRLVRRDTILTALYCVEDSRWTSIGSAPIHFDTLLVGPAFESADTAILSVTDLHGFSGGASSANTPVISLVAPVPGLVTKDSAISVAGFVTGTQLDSIDISVAVSSTSDYALSTSRIPVDSIGAFACQMPLGPDAYYRILAIDPVSGQSAVAYVIRDTRPPVFSIVPPDSAWCEGVAHIRMLLDEPGRIVFSINGNPYDSAVSPVDTSLYAQNDTTTAHHTVYFRGIDIAGNMSALDSAHYTVAPYLGVIAVPSARIIYDSASILLQASHEQGFVSFRLGQGEPWLAFVQPIRLKLPATIEAFAWDADTSLTSMIQDFHYDIVSRCSLSLASVGSVDTLAGDASNVGYEILTRSGDLLAGFENGAFAYAAMDSGFVFAAKPGATQHAIAGISVRASTDSAAKAYSLIPLSNQSILLKKRDTTDVAASVETLSVASTGWLKAERTLDTLRMFTSVNGKAWTFAYAAPWTGTALAGLVAGSTHPDSLASAQFDSVYQIVVDSTPALIVEVPSDSLRTKASSIIVQGRLRNVNAYGVFVNGGFVDVTQGQFADTIALVGQGSREIVVSTLDHSLSVTRVVLRDTIAPLLWANPPSSAGPFASPLSVTLSADEPASIQFRLDSAQTWQAYSAAIQLAADTSLDTTWKTIHFRGIDLTGDTSVVFSQAYVLITPPASYASPQAGTYNEPVEVVLQADRGANIHYTLDGASPNMLDAVYYRPILVDRTTVVRFFAEDQWGRGATHEVTYAITDTVAFDTLLVLGNAHGNAQWSTNSLAIKASGSSPADVVVRGLQPAQKFGGDFRVMIHLDSISGTAQAVAGLAVRTGTDTLAAVTALMRDTTDKLGLHIRAAYNGSTLRQALGTQTDGVWMQMIRRDSQLWSAYSADGIEWTPIPGSVSSTDTVWVGPLVSSGHASDSATAYFSGFHGFRDATAMPVAYPFLAIDNSPSEQWTSADSVVVSGRLYNAADTSIYVSVNGGYPSVIGASDTAWADTIIMPSDGVYEIHMDHIGSGIRSAGSIRLHRDATAPEIDMLPLNQDLLNSIPLEIRTNEACSIFVQIGSLRTTIVASDTIARDTLRVGESGLVRTWAIDSLGHHSPIIERKYRVHEPCSSWADPSDSVFYLIPTPVRLRSNSPDAVIYYTLDGSTPTTESSRFTGGYLQIFDSTTIRFFAADPWSVEQTIHTKIYTRPGYIEEAFRTYLDAQYDPTTRKIYFHVTSEAPVASYTAWVDGCGLDPSEFSKWVLLSPSTVLSFSDTMDLSGVVTTCSEIRLHVISYGVGPWDVSARQKTFTIDLSRIAVYRSVGPNRTTALVSGTGNSLTISGTAATFANSLPNNVGVGDVIQYDSDGNSSIDAIVFVSERISATSFTVKSASGLAPAHPVTGITVWSIYRAYTSLAAAENLAENTGIAAAVRDFDPWANGKNLLAGNETWNIACYSDSEDVYAGGGGVTIDGWTTGPENYLRIFTPSSASEVGASQRHDGKWNNSAYRLKAFVGLTIQDENVWIDGLQFTNNALNDNGLKSIQANGSLSTGLRITNCIMRLDTSAFSSYGDYCVAVDLGSDAPGDVYVHNNIIYGFRFGNRSNNHGILATQRNLAGNTYVYNNTVVDCKNGITGHWSATVIAKNNLVQGCADGYKSGFHVSSNHNLSNLAGDAPGASSVNSATVAFQNASAKDYHLSFSDTSARNAGVNLSADAGLPVTEDIDGRPRTGSWDIGADETYGLLAAASVSHATYMAGAEANVTISFTTENAAPATGTVRVIFGSGFDISQAAYVSGNSGASVSTSGQALTIMLGTAISASQQVSIVLADIRNPQSTGSGGSYAILTRTPAGDTLDAGTAAANTFTAGILSDASITHDSYSTGQTANTTISFVPDNPIPVNGDIQVTFGSGFNISSAGYASGNAGSTVSKSGQVLTINVGTSISAGSGVEIVISGIVNPSTDGSGGTYSIETQNAADVKIDTGTASANTFTTPTPVAVYYSVGTSTADLKTGSPTITLSAGTATLSGAQANNIGVGDEITYSTSSKCYISGRTSSTEYSVITATGGTPSNVTTQTVNSIKRAFNRLDSAVNVARAGSTNRASDANHLNTANLVGGNFRLNIACYGDSVEVSRVTVDGWTTGASNYIKIFTPTSSTEVGTSQRHNGRWKAAGAYALKTSTADIELFAIKDDYVRVDGLQIDAYKSGSAWQDGIVLYVGASADVRISNNILKGPLLPSTGIGKNEGNGSLYVWNNILYDWRHSNGANGIGIWDTTAYLYNNTLYNCQHAINAGVTPGVVVKNNLSYNNYSNYSYTGIGSFTGTNNLSGPGTSDNMPSTNGRNGVAVVFVDSAAKDFRLASADTGAADRGADLSADANLPFPDDILGTTRTGSWDIGAAEYIPTEADHNIYYSVGTNSGALHSGTGSASTKGLLVLSSSAANNIGVGDEVRVASNRYYIRKRESSTDFRIENSAANGGTPGDTNIVFGSQSVTIYRAFNRLDSAVNVARSGSSNRASDASHLGTTNLVSGNYVLHIVCYGDSVEVSRVTVDGWTTGASNYVKIYTPVSSTEVGTSQRHDGKLKTSGAYLLRTSTVDVCVIDIKDDYIRVDGIQVDAYKSGAAWMVGINIETGSSADVRVSNCILKGPLVASTGLEKSAGTGNVYFLNNILYDWKGSSEGQAIGFWTANGFAYNNTLYNNRVGINNAANCGGTLKNNLSYGNVYNYYAVSAYTGTNNLSGPGTNSAMPSTNSRNGVSVSFVDTANMDFHLSSNDAGAKNYGADLSSDGNLPFSTDIDGQTRSGTWDIGADEQQ